MRPRDFLIPLLWSAQALWCAGQIPPATKTIAVRVYVDEEEPRTERLWKETLAQRIDRASTILSQYGRIRFSVTKFGSWQSENRHREFAASLKEFEQKVNPYPAELAVGFTSQYRIQKGRSNLGGTRGPLRSHILIREGAPSILEQGRLEVLVHELAHYLGAAHSGRSDSVMRPVLGDGQSRARAFRIQLDPANAEIVRLVSTDLVRIPFLRSMHQLPIRTRQALRAQYAVLAGEFPKDEVAKRYVSLMDKSIQHSLKQREQQKKSSASPAPRQSSPPSGSALPR